MRLCVYTHAFYVVYRSELSSRGLRGFATVDYAPDGAVDYASGARCGLRGFALWSSGLEARARGISCLRQGAYAGCPRRL